MNFKPMSDLVHHGAEELQAIVQGTDPVSGFIVALVGGVVRDQLHGKIPRDIDIALIGSTPELVDHAIEILGELGWEIREMFDRDETKKYTERFPDEEDRFQSIIKMHRVYQGVGVPTHLDLLVYHERYEAIQDALDSFDHNIGQFAAWIGLDGKIEADFLGDPERIGWCIQLRKHVGAERIARVQEICANLQWDYVGEDF